MVVLPGPQKNPGDARHLVGQRHGRDLGGFAGYQVRKPWQVARATPLGMTDVRQADTPSARYRGDAIFIRPRICGL